MIFFFLLGSIVCSCSGPSHKVQRVVPKTQREVLLEKYRQMRLNAYKNNNEKRKRKRSLKKIRTTNKVQKIVFKKEPPKRKVFARKPKKFRFGDFEERQKEIDQNLTYHCIKYESKYSSDEECLEYANQVLIDCEVKAINSRRLSLIRCLKNELRIR